MKKNIFLILLFLNLNIASSHSSNELYDKIDLFGEVIEKIKTRRTSKNRARNKS